ncbi:ATP synthase protein I [Aureimonas endophytica]|uniref:ATP synthase protein I n=1 Tax=Aureimonas endophytica TaxID=2027858 RepID=A0A916ZUJ2_9HYPH|nr:AtpZ/AtpI family protein [Aureimonas endophytica]GGE14866.1 ATP synthase protein I [Aureimonas endophytica]
MAGEDGDEDLRRRGDALAARIAESRARLPGNQPEANRTQGMRGVAEGFKIASEFVAGVLVGTAIGYGIDSLFGTRPFGLIVFLLIGFAAGVLNVVRGTARSSEPPDGQSR